MGRHIQFWDLANMEAAFRSLEARIHYVGLRSYLAAGRQIVDAVCYLPINPYRPESRDALLRELRRLGFHVRTKVGQKRPGGKWKCNFDVEMACDILRFVTAAKPTTIVVCSGDRDMMEAYQIVREQGVRVEVAATQSCLAPDILKAASSFIDLGKVIAEQRAQIQRVNGNGAAVNALKCS